MGETYASAIPGYLGFVPGKNSETHISFGIPTVNIEACRQERTRASFDPQAQRKSRLEETDRVAKIVAPPRQPFHDSRGMNHPCAGDTRHSRIPLSGEEKVHLQSELDLTSHSHEERGGMGNLRGYGSASRSISGFTGHIPGKFAENVFGDGWSKQTERSVGHHLRAVRKGPKEFSLLTQGGTVVAPITADMLEEKPIRNTSYQDRTRGWSDCEYSGTQVDPAGRVGPKNRQEGYGGVGPPTCKHGIHGYSGWNPGRIGESVVGERQCKTNDISHALFLKNTMRITQR